jgi:anti-anti-sigma factor
MTEALDIRRSPGPGAVELKVSGRLDNDWSRQLLQALQEDIRAGRHAVRLDLSGVEYLSSAGIRVLLMCSRQVQGLGGSFSIESASAQAAEVLRLAGLGALLEAAPQPAGTEPAWQSLGGLDCSIRQLAASQPLKLSLLERGRGPRSEAFPEARYGVGVGALGQDANAGEFLAAAGAAACGPTDGRGRPDYAVCAGDLIARISVLYGLVWEGLFSIHMRFSAAAGAQRVSLSGILERAWSAWPGADQAAFLVVGEAAGLVGAALSRPPKEGRELFAFPAVKDNLFFTTERAHSRCLAVVAGVAARKPAGVLAELTRPLRPGLDLSGHFHAAVFPYRPLRQDETDPARCLRPLFEAGEIQALLHLLNDDRELVGLGESEFFQGV